jgi:hypothetical protein
LLEGRRLTVGERTWQVSVAAASSIGLPFLVECSP